MYHLVKHVENIFTEGYSLGFSPLNNCAGFLERSPNTPDNTLDWVFLYWVSFHQRLHLSGDKCQWEASRTPQYPVKGHTCESQTLLRTQYQ